MDAELQKPATPEPPPVPTTEQGRIAAYGPWEFQTEKWETAYIKRIDATIAALKSAGVPVLWVGLPSRSNSKASADSSYLNELYRSRVEKAGLTYVDIWDGFVDEQGRYSAQGPDYEGQTRRLRTGDGNYFTKYGARKLAHYVEREIERDLNRAMPVALPIPVETGPKGPGSATPNKPAQRPAAGPVLPLTGAPVASEELLGGGRAPARATPVDPIATRVLTKGEPVALDDRPCRRFQLAAHRHRGRAGGRDAGGDDGRSGQTQPTRDQRTDRRAEGRSTTEGRGPKAGARRRRAKTRRGSNFSSARRNGLEASAADRRCASEPGRDAAEPIAAATSIPSGICRPSARPGGPRGSPRPPATGRGACRRRRKPSGCEVW